MKVEVTMQVPELIYEIYAEAAKELGNISVEQAMASALHAYAQYLYQEMKADGELTEENTEQ